MNPHVISIQGFLVAVIKPEFQLPG
jgi:hypothetical protein